ncbi:uncharacterized protein [Rutidosis leptorrhynchoides]|uniref:uncharacterized protein n=1 Tax=Rutidosis leptorrhynchoides TaxID=125765 RepID=UPI003A9A6394
MLLDLLCYQMAIDKGTKYDESRKRYEIQGGPIFDRSGYLKFLRWLSLQKILISYKLKKLVELVNKLKAVLEIITCLKLTGSHTVIFIEGLVTIKKWYLTSTSI